MTENSAGEMDRYPCRGRRESGAASRDDGGSRRARQQRVATTWRGRRYRRARQLVRVMGKQRVGWWSQITRVHACYRCRASARHRWWHRHLCDLEDGRKSRATSSARRPLGVDGVLTGRASTHSTHPPAPAPP
jgi:hypothetical protein